MARYRLFALGPQVSYQLDFWGLARNNVRAADALLRSASYAQETVALTVTSNIATLYLDVLAIRQRIGVARNSLETARRVLRCYRKMDRKWPVFASRPRTATGARRGQTAIIPTLEQVERQARYALTLHLGRARKNFRSVGRGWMASPFQLFRRGSPPNC